MNNFLAVLAIIAGCIGLVWSMVYMAFWILNSGDRHDPEPVDEPVAWRVWNGYRYYFLSKADAIPQHAEPLYLGKK